VNEEPPPLQPELVRGFVAKARGDLEGVTELLGPPRDPLLEHAKVGREQARAVVELLGRREDVEELDVEPVRG
jgi:hypothetical protein